MQLQLVMILVGAITVVTGIVLMIKAPKSEDYVRSEAVFAEYRAGGRFRYVEPIVDIEIDGKTVRQSCAYLPKKYADALPGDKIGVGYIRSRYFGIEGLSIVVDAEGEIDRAVRISRAASGFMTAIGGVFMLIGVLLLIV